MLTRLATSTVRPREPHLLALDRLRELVPRLAPLHHLPHRHQPPLRAPFFRQGEPFVCCSRIHTLIYERAQVDPFKIPVLANWKHNYTLETVLVELRRYASAHTPATLAGRQLISRVERREMATPSNRKLPQPVEGTNF